jgi:signal recognition particle GTPase
VTFLAKERYTPKLNVETSIYDIFYGLGRTKEFFINVKKHNHKISDNFRYLKKEGTQKIILKDYIILEKRMNSILNFLTHLPNSGTNFVDFKKINQLCIKGQQIIRKILNIIEEWETKEQQEQSQITTHSNNEFREEKDHLYQVLYGLESLREFSESNQAISSNKPFILLSGIAGSGKTHFLCDLSENRLKNNQPTFIFLGEEFNKENP